MERLRGLPGFFRPGGGVVGLVWRVRLAPAGRRALGLTLTLGLALGLGLAGALAAGPGALRLSDVELMLRSGYASADVLREVTRHRVVETLAPDEENQLRALGAQPDLLAALRSGSYTLSPAEASQAEADRARLQQSQERERQLAEARLAAWRAANAAPKSAASRSPVDFLLGPIAPQMAQLVRELGPVRMRNGSLDPADTSLYPQKRLFAFYHSAHWCGPCRQFTPSLVQFYQKFAPAHPEFELVFVSADRSPAEMAAYMEEAKMPWPALPFEAAQHPPGRLPRSAGNGIPCLVLTDSSGRVLSDSYTGDGQKYLGPTKVLQDLEKLVHLMQHPDEVPRQAANAR